MHVGAGSLTHGPPLAFDSTRKAAKLNAYRLDNLHSTRFVEARGDINRNRTNFRCLLEHSEGAPFRRSTGTVVAHAPEGPPVYVSLGCPPSNQTGPGTLEIKNNTN